MLELGQSLRNRPPRPTRLRKRSIALVQRPHVIAMPGGALRQTSTSRRSAPARRKRRVQRPRPPRPATAPELLPGRTSRPSALRRGSAPTRSCASQALGRSAARNAARPTTTQRVCPPGGARGRAPAGRGSDPARRVRRLPQLRMPRPAAAPTLRHGGAPQPSTVGRGSAPARRNTTRARGRSAARSAARPKTACPSRRRRPRRGRRPRQTRLATATVARPGGAPRPRRIAWGTAPA